MLPVFLSFWCFSEVSVVFFVDFIRLVDLFQMFFFETLIVSPLNWQKRSGIHGRRKVTIKGER